MKAELKLVLFFIAIALAAAMLVFQPEKETGTEKISIAAWNMQVFGRAKAENSTLMEGYADLIDEYDMVLVQEIRDETGTAFSELCSLLPGYSCFTSSRSGRTSSKEEYGVIYKSSRIRVVSYQDMNPDPLDRWERPPLALEIKAGSENSSAIFIYVLHAKPSDVFSELNHLENLIENASEPTIIIGDLNADCSYFNREKSQLFESWNWLIGDEEDTTTGKTDCAYDRIIINSPACPFQSGYGIEKNVTSELSDHYIIWVELKSAE
mgnify:CR=1 FL=1